MAEATLQKTDNRRRAYWLKTLHEWHWVSSAMCLIGMLLFAVTGFTLNHAGQIESKPKVVSQQAPVPDALLTTLKALPAPPKDRAPLPELTELPVSTGEVDVGRFVLHPTRGHDVSIEERRAAAAVAQLLGQELARR